MKFLMIVTLTALTTLSAHAARQAEKETLVCQGYDESAGYSIKLEAKSQSNVEGKAIAYWTTVTQPNGVAYEGLVFGRKEDVQLVLSSRKNDNVDLKGTIFMDDATQVLVYKNGRKSEKLYLNCNVE